ncbi:unnamed protein product, partial [Sphacelaria rigidula]
FASRGCGKTVESSPMATCVQEKHDGYGKRLARVTEDETANRPSRFQRCVDGTASQLKLFSLLEDERGEGKATRNIPPAETKLSSQRSEHTTHNAMTATAHERGRECVCAAAR